MVGPLKNLLGKKSEYAIEIDEAKSDGSVATAEAKPAASAKPEPAKAEAPTAKAEPAKAAKTKSAKAPKAKSSKGAKPAAKPTPAVVSAPAPAPKAPEPAVGFASRYLMPTGNTPRRRPGPNMKVFLDMARTARK